MNLSDIAVYQHRGAVHGNRVIHTENYFLHFYTVSDTMEYLSSDDSRTNTKSV
jgi:hypothetical protein